MEKIEKIDNLNGKISLYLASYQSLYLAKFSSYKTTILYIYCETFSFKKNNKYIQNLLYKVSIDPTIPMIHAFFEAMITTFSIFYSVIPYFYFL